MKMTPKQFNKIFDHTLLKPPATKDDLKVICDLAMKYGFCTVAINAGTTGICYEMVKGSDVLVDSAVGFPLGITSIPVKVFETEDCIKNGAGEIDYVINVGKAKEGDWDYIKEEMEAIVTACHSHGIPCKVIFENCYLTDAEKIKLCEIANEVKPDYIKTSTGFGPTSATVEDVRLMRKHAIPEIKVKAAGGVRDLATCLAMLEAGADRIGCSASVAIAEAYAAAYTED